MRDDILFELQGEKAKAYLAKGKRIDGRSLMEYRPISIIPNFSKNADGSCRVKVGETDVIAGIKMEIGAPYPDSPNEGSISVGAEFTPMASPIFETGPPDEYSIELARVVDRCIRESKTLDFKQLLIEEATKAWIVNIDVYVVNDGGNLFDASSLAALGALIVAKIPKIEGDKIVKNEYSGKLELSCMPLLTTFFKIGNTIFADATISEEKAADARISVGSTENRQICAMQKGLAGKFTQQEIERCFEMTFEKADELRSTLKDALAAES
ncbi:MAG: exosome complex protein Rrp42 [Candidatus Diapherotrites archaeon]|nr:exosome complex protein Rrp42 [Candidatus Diapherotrites archaeon]